MVEAILESQKTFETPKKQYGNEASIKNLLEEDINWLKSIGTIKKLSRSELFFSEGEYDKYLYLIKKGSVELSICGSPETEVICRIKENDIFGGKLLISRLPYTYSATALEETEVVAVSIETIKEKEKTSLSFSSRLYRALAILTYENLDSFALSKNPSLEKDISSNSYPAEIGINFDHSNKDLVYSIFAKAKFWEWKELMVDADTESRKFGQVTNETQKRIQDKFFYVTELIHTEIGLHTKKDEYVTKEVAERFKREFLPYLLMSQLASRAYSKPLGYAGDYLTVQQFYDNIPNGIASLGKIIDECFLKLPTSNAVRNRRELITHEIKKIFENRIDKSKPLEITTIASGPAREVLDLIENSVYLEGIKFNLIDIDIEALNYVNDELKNIIQQNNFSRKLRRQFNYFPADLVKYLKEQTLPVKNQDLVYAIGIADYLDDQVMVALMNIMHGALAPGGTAIIGNFDHNPCDALMRYVIDWKLNLRTQEQLMSLAKSSSLQSSKIEVLKEQENINLFLKCTLPN